MSGVGPSRRPADHRPWYREPLVWLVVAIPGSAVVMGALLLALATRSYDGLVADDYYRRGLEINRSFTQDRAAEAYGLRGVMRMDGRSGEVHLELESVPGFRGPDALTLEFIHGTRSGLDRRVRLARRPVGGWRARVEPLAPGPWNLQLSAGDWRLLGRMRIPGPSRVELGPGIGGAGE